MRVASATSRKNAEKWPTATVPRAANGNGWPSFTARGEDCCTTGVGAPPFHYLVCSKPDSRPRRSFVHRHHVIISGTGRSGTTFLMQLLTHMGLDTGYSDASSGFLPHCKAGMEREIEDENAPYIIKSPWLCTKLDDLIERGVIHVDLAIIPVRDLFSAAQSRRDVSAKTDPALFPGHVPGGVWLTDDGEKQESVLAAQFYQLMHALTKHRVPTTLLLFPRMVRDPEYLYEGLRGLLVDLPYEAFLPAFETVARPEWVHDFAARPG